MKLTSTPGKGIRNVPLFWTASLAACVAFTPLQVYLTNNLRAEYTANDDAAKVSLLPVLGSQSHGRVVAPQRGAAHRRMQVVLELMNINAVVQGSGDRRRSRIRESDRNSARTNPA